VTGGVVGTQKFAFDVWGNTVNVAARIQQTADPGRVHVSEETMRQCGDGYRFEPAASSELKGLGPIRTYYLID
jgi:class 3 adenylate cyclase